MASTITTPPNRIATPRTIIMPTAADDPLYRLLAWSSPAYPIGAYSYSHGIEWAVETGLLRDRKGVVAWLASVLADGAGKVDGAFFAAAWRAASERDDARLDEIAALALAWRGTAELALEAEAQGTAFLTVTLAAWPHPNLAAASRRWQGCAALPVAAGMAAGCHGVPLEPALVAYLGALVANLVSAALRLVPLGQTDAQIAIAALAPSVAAAASAAIAADLDELGSAVPMVDWCSMRHETQYTRLFRS
jgi:urease accessory protein